MSGGGAGGKRYKYYIDADVHELKYDLVQVNICMNVKSMLAVPRISVTVDSRHILVT